MRRVDGSREERTRLFLQHALICLSDTRHFRHFFVVFGGLRSEALVFSG